MTLLLPAIGLLLFSGLWALKERHCVRGATFFGAGGAVAGCLLGLIAAVMGLVRGGTDSFSLPWHPVLGSLSFQIDPLSCFFLLPIFALSGLAAVYGGEYMQARPAAKALGGAWFWYNTMVASLALVVTAHNGAVFLLAWEAMSLSSFFLVTFDNDKPEVREAGWTYLVATHLGTAFLLAMFVILGARAGSLDFDAFGRMAALPAGMAGMLFLFAVAGFGAKAGFMPFHVWMPEAYPVAPSHVTAVMSGVMSKTGIYGILRMLTFLDAPAAWWGWVLVGVGIASGILGVLFALAQHDLKRLLAYSSVENIGIIALGMGLGLIGLSSGVPALAALGFGGALLHVINHAAFKGLLFLGAGAALHGTGTRRMDALGGLLKRMRWTGAAFLVGAVAICGLPPLNGFASEFLLYAGSFIACAGGGHVIAGLAAIVALALIGGLAAACFAKAFGIVLLGEPRSECAVHAHDAGWAMRVPMLILAAACLGIGLLSPRIVPALEPVIGQLTGQHEGAREAIRSAGAPLSGVVVISALFFLLLAGLILLRARLLKNRPVTASGTWDCGYARPTARMQYTSSSFAQPLTFLFRSFLRTRSEETLPHGILPREASLRTETPDVFMAGFFRPVFTGATWALSHLRQMQHGRVQLYVLYVALALLVLLIWLLGGM